MQSSYTCLPAGGDASYTCLPAGAMLAPTRLTNAGSCPSRQRDCVATAARSAETKGTAQLPLRGQVRRKETHPHSTQPHSRPYDITICRRSVSINVSTDVSEKSLNARYHGAVPAGDKVSLVSTKGKVPTQGTLPRVRPMVRPFRHVVRGHTQSVRTRRRIDEWRVWELEIWLGMLASPG